MNCIFGSIHLFHCWFCVAERKTTNKKPMKKYYHECRKKKTPTQGAVVGVWPHRKRKSWTLHGRDWMRLIRCQLKSVVFLVCARVIGENDDRHLNQFYYGFDERLQCSSSKVSVSEGVVQSSAKPQAAQAKRVFVFFFLGF